MFLAKTLVNHPEIERPLAYNAPQAPLNGLNHVITEDPGHSAQRKMIEVKYKAADLCSFTTYHSEPSPKKTCSF